MLNKSVVEFTYEIADDGSRIDVLEVYGSNEKSLTITELRDFLNELIEEGYGDYKVEADTQDGSTYSVKDDVMVFNKSKVVTIF